MLILDVGCFIFQILFDIFLQLLTGIVFNTIYALIFGKISIQNWLLFKSTLYVWKHCKKLISLIDELRSERMLLLLIISTLYQ